MLLLKSIQTRTKQQFKMMCIVQGIDLAEDTDEQTADKGDEDLPDELIEMERAYRERKATATPEEKSKDEMADFMLGYQKVVSEVINHN